MSKSPCVVKTVVHEPGSPEWVRRRNAAFLREWKKTLPEGMTPEEKKKVYATVPKLLKYLDTGALNDQTFAAALVDQFGGGVVKPEVVKKLQDLADKADEASNDTVRDKLYAEMGKIIDDEAAFSVWDAIARGDWWFASVLMRFGTFTNVVSGSFLTASAFQAMQTLDTAIAKRNPRMALKQLGMFVAGALDAAQTSKEIIAKGRYDLLPDAKVRNFDILNGKRGSDVLEALWRRGNAAGTLAYTRRIMAALDYLFAQGVRDSTMLYAALSREDKASVDAIMRRYDAAVVKAADEQARQEMGPDATPGEVRKRKREILEQGISDEIRQTAVQLARRSAANADPVGISGKIYDVTKSWNWSVKALSGLSFLRAAMNTIRTAGDFIPGVGLVTLYRSSDFAKERYNKTALEPFMVLDITPEERRMAAYSQIMGFGVLAGMLHWAQTDDPDEEGWEISGGWINVTPQQAKQLRAQRQQPYAVRLPGRKEWISYKQSPLAPILASIGAIRDNKRFDAKKWDEKSSTDKAIYAYTSSMKYVKDVASLGQFAYAWGLSAGRTEEPNAAAANEFLSRTIGRAAGGMVPSVVGEIQQIFDPTLRAPTKDETLGYWWKNFPIASLANKPVLNFFGEPTEGTRPPARALMSIEKTDPIYQFVGKWFGEGLFVPQAGQTAQVYDPKTGAKRRMTPEEAYEYQRVFGQTFKSLLEQAIPQIDQNNRQVVEAVFDKLGDASAKVARGAIVAKVVGN